MTEQTNLHRPNMQRNMQETSLNAYFGEILPSLGKRHRAILSVFTENQAMNFTNTEIADELEIPINTVTPRVYELRGRDKRIQLRRPILVEGMKRICTITKRRVIAWQLNLAGLIPEGCPGCGSEHVGKYDKRWYCGSCGRTFPSEDHPPSTISWKKEGTQ